jgi:hypothetical protein
LAQPRATRARNQAAVRRATEAFAGSGAAGLPIQSPTADKGVCAGIAEAHFAGSRDATMNR